MKNRPTPDPERLTLDAQFPGHFANRPQKLGLAVRRVMFCLGVLLLQPAMSDAQELLLLSESQERELAEQEHPKIVAAFGGEHQDEELQRYVKGLVDFLGKTSERPDIEYRITILNSPIVNAFALPAGYLYVTRGLLTLADNEQELAGVLAHEIGHVTARHATQRYSQSVLAQGLIGLLGVFTQDTQLSGLSDLLQPVAILALRSYSREHEFEADQLGIKTMARAGFDPHAMSSFLTKLERQTELEKSLKGKSGGDLGLFSTHPRTAERVDRAIELALGNVVRNPIREREIYLAKLDGLLYGDDPKQGVVRDRVFLHPDLDFRFEVPEGFEIVNGATAVTARGPNGTNLTFDLDGRPETNNPARYIRDFWAKDYEVRGLEEIRINGMRAATGSLRLSTRRGQSDLRLVVLRAARDQFYRFVFVAPPNLRQRYDPEFRRTAYSFRRLTGEERRSITVQHLRTRAVSRGETLQQLADQMPFDEMRLERFLILNGLKDAQDLRSGQIVKLIEERRWNP